MIRDFILYAQLFSIIKGSGSSPDPNIYYRTFFCCLSVGRVRCSYHAAGCRRLRSFSRKNRRDRSKRRSQNSGPRGDSAGPAGLPGAIGRCAQDHVPQGVAGRAQHRECRGQKASGDEDGAEQEIWRIQRSQDEIECDCYWQADAKYPSICKLRRCRMATMFASACRHQVTADHTAMGSDIPR